MAKTKTREVRVTRTIKTKASKFARIDNALLQDARLGFDERGVMAYVISMPTHWRHSADTLAKVSNKGAHSVRSALRALVKAGYATLKKSRDESGRITHQWYFTETPSSDLPHSVDHETAPSTQKPEDGSPSLGKPAGFETTVSETTVAAATAAATANTDSDSSPESCTGGISAFPGAVAPAALIPDGQWLPDQLSLLDLRRVQLSTPSTAKLELWQIADIYAAFATRKRDYPADIKKARTGRPDLQPWKWFGEQLTSQKSREWGYMVGKWSVVKNLDPIRSTRNAAQPTNAEPADCEWQMRLHELPKGEPVPNWTILYDTDLGVMPGKGIWPAVPAWIRAIINTNYRAGVVPEPPTTKR